jgi:hypothetical protein
VTAFTPGDRVRRISEEGFGPAPTEQVGVVSPRGQDAVDNVEIIWEDGHRRGVFPYCIEVITEPEPVASELRERLIRLVTQYTPTNESPEDIVNRARIMESYIQGDTK